MTLANHDILSHFFLTPVLHLAVMGVVWALFRILDPRCENGELQLVVAAHVSKFSFPSNKRWKSLPERLMESGPVIRSGRFCSLSVGLVIIQLCILDRPPPDGR